MVEESDMDQLPYFRAVVKEVLRLHPPGPLMMPHSAQSSCEVAGFVIPKHTQKDFNLEGENSKMDYKGQNFEFIPFGAGRKICVGLPLASQMIYLVLASLLHSFEWALPSGMSAEQLDMNDEFGLTLKKAVQLQAIPTPRLPYQIY
ncbi:hypothetical protein SUGI_0645430 [Cryptomeria japonica]|nr:hypothetical protein SUGI_0645430 [Cryptomeria japonica]